MEIPWGGMNKEQVIKIRSSLTLQELYRKEPNWMEFMAYVMRLPKNERPDYKYLCKLISHWFHIVFSLFFNDQNHFWSELLPTIAKCFNFKSLSPTNFSFVLSYYFITYGFVMPIRKSIGFVIGLCSLCVGELAYVWYWCFSFSCVAKSSSYLFISSFFFSFSCKSCWYLNFSYSADCWW